MKPVQPLKLYLTSVLIGFLLDLSLITAVCFVFDFQSKSAISLLAIGSTHYLFKALFFFAVYLRFPDSSQKKTLIIWAPLIFFTAWFIIIIVFRIDSLSHDISYGYTQRFPHFLLQLLATLLTCLYTQLRLRNITLNPSES
jgi:hypothetical protein